jgi:hypothetical protein
MKVVVVLGRRFFLLPMDIRSCRQSKKVCGAWNTENNNKNGAPISFEEVGKLKNTHIFAE